jgi:hypothetical protein
MTPMGKRSRNLSLTDVGISVDEVQKLRTEAGGTDNEMRRSNEFGDDNDSLASGEITTVNTTKFSDIGRIPDIVKDIPQFNGKASKLMQWISDVDSVIDIFSSFKGTHHYRMVVQTIRRKIIGEADEILISNNTLLSWKEIRKTLLTFYGDQRDLMTLDSQLHNLSRRNDSIETFYAKVQSMLSLIANSIQLDDDFAGGEKHVLKLYNKICLDIFIRGVGSPLSQFLRNFKPKSLGQAYQYALDFQNAEFRSSVNITSTIPRFSQPKFLQRPNDQFRHGQHPNFQNRNQSFPNSQSRPFYSQQNSNRPQPVFNETQRPEPMDVDHSLRTRFPQRPAFEKQALARPAQDSNSWRVHAPPNKRMANLAALDGQNSHCFEAEETDYQRLASEQCDLGEMTEYLRIDDSNDETNLECANFSLDEPPSDCS